MLNVDIEKILPVTEVRDSLNKIVDEVSSSDELYVLTVNGKPSAVVVGVQHLEKLTGNAPGDLMSKAAASATTNSTDSINDAPAATDANQVDVKPAEPLPTDSTPNQPLVGTDAAGTEAPMPAEPDQNIAPTDTAQTTQPGPQQDVEAAVPLNGEPVDASPVTTGQNITPQNDPFETPGPDDLFGQSNNGSASQNTNDNQSNNTPPTQV